MLVFTALLSACFGTERWTEEVRLANVNVITVERETLRKSGGGEWASNRGGSMPKEHRIKFSAPNAPGKMIEWRSTKISSDTWPEDPLLLDFESELPVLISIGSTIGNYEYFKYVYRNGVWVENEFAESFKERPSNLFIGGGVDMPKVVDLSKKSAAMHDSAIPKAYKKIGPTKKGGNRLALRDVPSAPLRLKIFPLLSAHSSAMRFSFRPADYFAILRGCLLG